MTTTRLRFSADILWPAEGQAAPRDTGDDAFAFLRTGETQVDRADLEWLCDRLVVETGAPAMTMDLRAPRPRSGCCSTSDGGFADQHRAG